jgi:hypothetical protein
MIVSVFECRLYDQGAFISVRNSRPPPRPRPPAFLTGKTRENYKAGTMGEEGQGHTIARVVGIHRFLSTGQEERRRRARQSHGALRHIITHSDPSSALRAGDLCGWFQGIAGRAGQYDDNRPRSDQAPARSVKPAAFSLHSPPPRKPAPSNPTPPANPTTHVVRVLARLVLAAQRRHRLLGVQELVQQQRAVAVGEARKLRVRVEEGAALVPLGVGG